MNEENPKPRRTNDSLIAQARIAKGWTQKRLADAIGTSQPCVGEWETGVRNPKINTLKRIAEALGVDWTTLVK